MKVSKLINIVVLLYISYFFIPDIMIFLRTNRLPMVPINILGQNYLLIILLGLLIVFRHQIFFSKPMRYVYLYYFVFFLFRISGYYDTESVWFDKYHLTIFISVLLYTHYIGSKDYKGLSIIANGMLYMIMIASLLNMFQLNLHPESARAYGATDTFRYFGVFTYSLPSTLPFFIPILFWYRKYGELSRIKKILIIIGIIVIYVSIVLTSITAPILIASVGVIFATSGMKRLKVSLALSFMIIVIILIIPSTFYSNILFKAADIIGNKSVNQRIQDVGYGLEHGVDVNNPTTSLEQRVSRVPLNLKQFAEYPLFGKGVEGNAHLFWLNYLAQFGLFGTIPLLLILYNQFRNSIKLFSENFKFYYLLSIFLFIFSGFIKAYSYMFFFMIIFVIPSMYYLPLISKKSNKKI